MGCLPWKKKETEETQTTRDPIDNETSACGRKGTYRLGNQGRMKDQTWSTKGRRDFRRGKLEYWVKMLKVEEFICAVTSEYLPWAGHCSFVVPRDAVPSVYCSAVATRCHCDSYGKASLDGSSRWHWKSHVYKQTIFKSLCRVILDCTGILFVHLHLERTKATPRKFVQCILLCAVDLFLPC